MSARPVPEAVLLGKARVLDAPPGIVAREWGGSRPRAAQLEAVRQPQRAGSRTMTSIEFPSPTGFLQATLQRSIDLVAFGLHAQSAAQPTDLSIPDSFGQVVPARNLAMDVATARREFSTWVLANGFRDCVDAIGPTLEWARKVCFFWSRPGVVTSHPDGRLSIQSGMTGAEWNEGIVERSSWFDRLSLPDKLRHLETEFDLQPFPLRDQVLTLNAARNCLTHRNGVVGPLDLRQQDDTGILVRWWRLAITVSGEQGERVLHGPGPVDAGEHVGIGFEETSRLFALGARIQFDTQDYVQICMTFLMFALQIERAIKYFQDRRRPDAAAGPTP